MFFSNQAFGEVLIVPGRINSQNGHMREVYEQTVVRGKYVFILAYLTALLHVVFYVVSLQSLPVIITFHVFHQLIELHSVQHPMLPR